MKKVVLKYLSKKYLYAALCEVFKINPGIFKVLNIGHGYAADAFHDQYILIGIRPMNLRYM